MIKKKFLKSKPVCKITFAMHEEAFEGAKKVEIIGEFNDWDTENGIPMKKQKNGMFKATVDVEVGKEYQFRYLLDGEKWENDWEADKYVPTELGIENSVVIAIP